MHNDVTQFYGYSYQCARQPALLKPCVFCTERIIIITERDMSKLSSTCTVIPPLNRKYYGSGKVSIHTPDDEQILLLYTNNTVRATWRSTLCPITPHTFVNWHSGAVVTTYTSCLDNTNSYSCAQCIYLFHKTLPINSDWCSIQLHNAVFTAQWELNCNNILTNLKRSKLMPLTAEARVRSQASLRDICGVKCGGRRFSLQYVGLPPSVCHRCSALNIIQRSKSGNLKKITLFRKSGTMGRKGILYCLRSLQPALRLQCIQQHSLTAGHDQPKRSVCVTFRADTTSVRRATGHSNNAE